MANYESYGLGYRCFIDNMVYSKVEDIPDYGDWAVLETHDNLNPRCYFGGTVVDVSKLPADHEHYPFLKRGCTALTRTGKLYAYNANVKEWQTVQGG